MARSIFIRNNFGAAYFGVSANLCSCDFNDNCSLPLLYDMRALPVFSISVST